MADGTFFDFGTMGAASVQAFLDARVPVCQGVEPTCLRHYRAATTDQPAEPGLCLGYTATPSESAAEIITRVAASCGVNPQVLLVLLQKEQALVTSTAPTAAAYAKATGFACPDGAPCDTQYAGLFNQLYRAARQFKRYALAPQNWGYRAGRVNRIYYHPSLDAAGCGSSQVYIQNQATAGLYNYTPYQPNAAALANLTGAGDGCSAYGNRNFWRLFSDWFGSTQGGGFLSRTVADPTVYLIAGDRKHPVDSMATAAAFARLGSIGTVSQAYLDSKVTGTALRRLVRDRAGAISFVDSGWRLRFTSCQQVADFGYDCNDVPELTAVQIEALTPGGDLSRFVTTSSSPVVYEVFGGRKHAVGSWELLLVRAGGTAPVISLLSDAGLGSIPDGEPLLAPGALAKSPASDQVYLVDGLSAKVPVTSFADVQSLAGTRGVAVVSQATLDGLTTATGPLSPAVQCGSQHHLGLRGQLRPVDPGTAGSWGVPFTRLDPSTCRGLGPVGGPAPSQLFVATPVDAVVWYVSGGVRQALDSWAVLLELAGGSPPELSTFGPASLAVLPAGTVVLTPGAMVKATGDDRVYLLDRGTKLTVDTFSDLAALGVDGPLVERDAGVLGPFTTRPGYLRPLVACGGSREVGIAGVRRPVDPAAAAAAGDVWTSLDPVTCSTLGPPGLPLPGPVLVKAADRPEVYVLESGTRRHVTSWAALVRIAGTTSVEYAVVGPRALATLPEGPPVA